MRLGDKILKDRSNPTHHYRIWVGVAVLFGMTVLYNVLIILACKYLQCELRLKGPLQYAGHPGLQVPAM